MNRAQRRLLLATTCLLQLVATPTEATPSGEIVITGRVVDDDGMPIEDAVVKIVPAKGSRSSAARLIYRIYGGEPTAPYGLPDPARTDETGRFTLEIRDDWIPVFRRRACERDLNVSRDGYLPLATSLRRLTVGGTCDPYERAQEPKVSLRRLDLPPAVLEVGSDVEVRVLLASGESASDNADPRAAAGAWIRAWEDASESTWQRAERIVQADADGTAHFQRARGGATRISAYLPKSAPSEAVLPAEGEEGDDRVTLRLGEAGPQELRIIRESGIPLGEVSVALLPGHWPVGYTNSRGLVEIYRPPGPAEIELPSNAIQSPVRLPARTYRGDHRLLVDLGAPRPEFDPDAGPSVYGLVLSEQGDPVAGALVVLRARRSRQGDEFGVAVSGNDGSFQLTLPEPTLPSDRNSSPARPPELSASATGFLDYTEFDIAANVALGGAALGPPLEIVLRRDLRVAGTVKTTFGEPVPGTIVALSNPANPGAFTGPKSFSDLDGAFVLEGIDPEVSGLGLSVIHFDYVGREVALSELPEPPAAAEIVLEEATSFRGRVLDPAGEPLQDVSVIVLQDEPKFNLLSMFYDAATTRDDGTFQLDGLAYGRHELEFGKAGYRRLVREITASNGSADQQEDFELELLPTYTVSGRLVGESSQLEGLRVMLGAHEAGSRRHALDLFAISDAGGVFRIEGVPPGRYVAAASSADRQTLVPVRELAVMVDGPMEIEVVLEPQTAVTGRILGLRPEQLAHVRVANGEVDPAAGSFRVEGLVPGVHRLRANLDPGPDWPASWATARVEVEPGQSEQAADIAFEPPRRLYGTVRRADRPVAGALVALTPAPYRRGLTTTDDRGGFEFDGVTPGRYQVTVRNPTRIPRGREGRRLATKIVEVDGDRELMIDVDETGGLTVSGRVVNGDGGDPLAGVLLQLTQYEANEIGRPDRRPVVFSRRDGTFRFEDLPCGTWRLQLKKDGFGDAVVMLDLPDEEGELPDLEMTSTEGLDLRIRSPRGVSPGSALVSLLDDEGYTVSHATLAARQEGWMRLSSAPEGRWRLLVQGDGLAALGEVEIPGPPAEMSADYGATLRVNALFLPDLANDVARLEILDAQRRPVFMDLSFRGSREVLTLPAGRFYVRVTSDDSVWNARVDLLPGAYEVLEIESPEPPGGL